MNKSNNTKTATKGDIKDLRVEIRKSLEKTERVIMLKVENRIQRSEENLKEAIRRSTNDLMTKIDSFAGRTKTLEDENTIGTHQIEELRGKVEDHEGRITKLESPAA